MKAILKILTLCVIIVLTAFSCEKEEVLLPYHVNGRIIQIFTRCYGEWIMIEVENPKGIGMEGTFAFPGNEKGRINYKNAIAVPYLSKTNTEIPPELKKTPIKVGTWLYFEYRDVKEEEKSLFRTFPPIVCPANISPPPAKGYIITKIIKIN